MEDKQIVTRFAPSPTGLLHAGNYRTAVFSYLYARRYGGKFLLRIEDTDKERSKEEYAENILESLAWLSLEFDNADSIARQSERSAIYKKYLEQLLAEDKAYLSKEEVKKEGDRSEVIRFRNPNKVVSFQDLVRGQISMDTSDLGDFVIAKSIDEPIFHLAVVVDDFEMGITHIVRGEDHISNTPRQILIQEAIGAPTPKYAHLPLVLAPDRTKLSKRKGALAITEYRDRGYLPDALLNFMAMLGWNPGTEQEIFSKAELVQIFDLAQVQKGGAIFDETKLNWYNREYLRRLSPTEFLTAAEPFLAEVKKLPHYSDEMLKKIVPILLERIYTLSELRSMYDSGDIQYYFEAPAVTKELLKSPEYLADTAALLKQIAPENWTVEGIKSAIWDFATEKGRGLVLWPLRVALSGKEKSPDPFTLAAILGPAETLKRIANAQNI
jgi:glutamyl-tRNA synthetase